MKKRLLPFLLLVGWNSFCLWGMIQLTQPPPPTTMTPPPVAEPQQPNLLYLQAPGHLPLTFRL